MDEEAADERCQEIYTNNCSTKDKLKGQLIFTLK